MPIEQTGAILTQAPSDWQILQQDADGVATINLAGRWNGDAGGRVEVAVLYEATSSPVCRATDWQPATTNADRTWTHTLRVPAGGLYRLETRYRQSGQLAGEWSTRGDQRHFFGVGDLWVITGQSNSAGYGRGPIADAPELGIHLFRNNETWSLATHPMNDSTDTRHPANRENANSGHSPYLNFARVLRQHLHYPIGLIQTSLGGSPLSRWNPTEPGDSSLYETMLHCIGLCGGTVKGFLWYQGESDTGSGQRHTYAARFGKAIAAWRNAIQQPDAPVLTVQLNRVQNPTHPDPTVVADLNEGWSVVREQQRLAAHTLPYVGIVPACDLPLSDQIHVSPVGNMTLGDRLARLALGMVHGVDLAHRAPDLATASRDGNLVRLTFDHVVSRLDSFDSTCHPFNVWAGDGDLPVAIASVAYDSPTTAVLTLAEPLPSPGAPLTVSAGHGYNPLSMPHDRERMVSLLCFHRVPVA